MAWVAYASAEQAVAGWQVCPTDPESLGPCELVSTRTGDGWVSSSTRPSGHLQASITSNGYVALWSRPRGLRLLDAAGTIARVGVDARPEPAGRFEPVFGSGWVGPGVETDLWAYDRIHHVARPVPPTPQIKSRPSAVRTRGGRLWVEGWGTHLQVWVAWTDDGGATWTEHRLTRSGYPGGLAVAPGGQVAAFAWNDHAASLRGASQISRDNGATWARFHLAVGPTRIDSEGIPGGPSAVTRLTRRTIFVVDAATHTLWTSTGDWSSFHQVPRAGRVSWVQSNHGLLWAGGHDNQHIELSTDYGRTWHAIQPR
ncbi:MAG: sialidase family protein [Nocardioidaceae bacterium]